MPRPHPFFEAMAENEKRFPIVEERLGTMARNDKDDEQWIEGIEEHEKKARICWAKIINMWI